ncbi:MAG: polysaccharide deacetylase family protein [Bacteroidota bacterium]
MKVTVPNIALPEVEYTFHCLLGEFLGINYKLEVDKSCEDFTISNRGKNIVIKNHFFKNDHPDSWYQLAQIPNQISRGMLDLGGKKYLIHSIFGKAKLSRVGEGYILEADIIASTFFMLTRWEEAVNPKRDNHQRFSAKDALAYQQGFLQDAIVNEYVEFLWKLLEKIGVGQKRRKRSFQIVPTHDVDVPFLFSSLPSSLYTITRHLVDPTFFRDGVNYLNFFFNRKDPNDTHAVFLDGAEKLGTPAHFFFMSGGKNKYDPKDQLTSPSVRKLIQKIKERGHSIGLHPSYESFDNEELFKQEKDRLQRVANVEIKTGRQHYLRFEVPTTWNLWENADMTWESSMSYADDIGFRCGVCYPFPVFDIFQRKRLSLYERPLILMEGTLGMYLNLSLEEAQKQVEALVQEVEKYQGEFVFLWHNSSLNLRIFARYNPILFDLYKS